MRLPLSISIIQLKTLLYTVQVSKEKLPSNAKPLSTSRMMDHKLGCHQNSLQQNTILLSREQQHIPKSKKSRLFKPIMKITVLHFCPAINTNKTCLISKERYEVLFICASCYMFSSKHMDTKKHRT